MSTINPVTTPPPFINRPRETLLVRAEVERRINAGTL